MAAKANQRDKVRSRSDREGALGYKVRSRSDREGALGYKLERLCRYIARPAIAEKRLSLPVWIELNPGKWCGLDERNGSQNVDDVIGISAPGVQHLPVELRQAAATKLMNLPV